MLFAACTGVMNITIGSKRDDARMTEAYVQVPVTSQLVDVRHKQKSALRKRKTGGAMETDYSVRPTSIILLAQRSGAKDAPKVSPHFAQIMYFGLVSSLATAPFHYSLSQATGLFCAFFQNRIVCALQAFLVCIAGFLSRHFFSIAHPYLLADNRHYTFYLWRKIINHHWSMKYLLVLPYAYSWISIISALSKKVAEEDLDISLLPGRLYGSCPCPPQLIEFRYYTLPFYFLVLHSRIDNDQDWILIGLQYVVMNIFTMAMLLFRPFKWDHEPGTQRFIW